MNILRHFLGNKLIDIKVEVEAKWLLYLFI